MYPSSQQAFRTLQDYSKNRRSSQDIQRESEAKYDIPGITTRLSRLRSLVGNLENSVEQVDPSVTGRTQGFNVTEAQRSALVNRERAPILSDLSKQQGALGQEQQNFSLSSTLADQMARNIRSDDETGYQRLLDSYNAATASEQQQEAKRQFEANLTLEREKLATQQRAAAAGNGYDPLKYVRDILADRSGSGLPKLVKDDKGFNFFDAEGNPITAAQYAPLANIGYRELLARMAAEGDKNAKLALGYVGDDARFGAAPSSLRGSLSALGAMGNYIDNRYGDFLGKTRPL